MAYLQVDDRERAVIAELATLAPDQRDWGVAHLGNGDYSIIDPETQLTLVMLERKTYSDFASSIKDGRIDNIARALALNPPRFGIILEGRTPAPDARVDGIPVANIRAKIDHLWMRDNVYLIETRSPIETAARLLALRAHIVTLIAKQAAPAHAHTLKVGAKSLAELPVPAPTLRDDVIAMLCCIPTIGPVKARAILDTGTSLAQYIARDDTPYAANMSSQLDCAMLSAIRGISATRAADILKFARDSLRALIAMDADALDKYTFNGKHAHATTSRILDCAHYNTQPAQQ